MRRATVFVAVLALAAGCGGDDDDTGDHGVVDRSRDVPADVQSFLDRVAPDGEVAFRATYSVLKRFGGQESTVEVESSPPDVTIRAGDVEVVNGEGEAALSDVGIFSGFTTTAPAAAIRAAATRADAGEAQRSTREAAGVELDCVAVPVQDAIAITACLTPEGIFGYVDNAAVRYELTAYEVL